jgi:hypothetical protein
MAMELRRPDDSCKGCRENFEVTEQQIQRLLKLFQEKGFDCAPDEIYRARLAACMRCPSLVASHTCLHCGCIVQVRAKLMDKDCPNPEGTRWAV